MNRFRSKRNILIMTVFITAILLAIYFETQPRTIPGQAPLADISDMETLRTQFNQDAGKTRLIILVSPT
jgi:hypothetical protein